MAALCTLLHSANGESSLIFGRTKFGVEKLGKHLTRLGFAVGTLHGDKSQRAREDVLTAFRRGQIHTLLATNVAARGLDIKGIHQVINYELPESSDLFTHRIGRTGRMGQQGKAITLLAPSDLSKWRHMARSLGQAVTLQRLTIDENALTMQAPARPEVVQEPEQHIEQRPQRPERPVRERRRFPSEQELNGEQRAERPRTDSRPAFDRQRQPKEDEMPMRVPAWAPESTSMPERPYSDRARTGRRGVGPQAGPRRTPAKRTAAPTFVATEPKQRTGRRKPGTTVNTRRATVSTRFSGR